MAWAEASAGPLRQQIANAQANILINLTDVDPKGIFSSTPSGGSALKKGFKFRELGQQGILLTSKAGLSKKFTQKNLVNLIVNRPDLLEDFLLLTNGLRGYVEEGGRARYSGLVLYQGGEKAYKHMGGGLPRGTKPNILGGQGQALRLSNTWEDMLKKIQVSIRELWTTLGSGTPHARELALQLEGVKFSQRKLTFLDTNLNRILSPIESTVIPDHIDRRLFESQKPVVRDYLSQTRGESGMPLQRRVGTEVDKFAGIEKAERIRSLKGRTTTQVLQTAADVPVEGALKTPTSTIFNRYSDVPIGQMETIKVATPASQLTGGAGAGTKRMTQLPAGYFQKPLWERLSDLGDPTGWEEGRLQRHMGWVKNPLTGEMEPPKGGVLKQALIKDRIKEIEDAGTRITSKQRWILEKNITNSALVNTSRVGQNIFELKGSEINLDSLSKIEAQELIDEVRSDKARALKVGKSYGVVDPLTGKVKTFQKNLIGYRLDVPFEEKATAKHFNARWDPKGKFWWMPIKYVEEQGLGGYKISNLLGEKSKELPTYIKYQKGQSLPKGKTRGEIFRSWKPTLLTEEVFATLVDDVDDVAPRYRHKSKGLGGIPKIAGGSLPVGNKLLGGGTGVLVGGGETRGFIGPRKLPEHLRKLHGMSTVWPYQSSIIPTPDPTHKGIKMFGAMGKQIEGLTEEHWRSSFYDLEGSGTTSAKRPASGAYLANRLVDVEPWRSTKPIKGQMELPFMSMRKDPITNAMAKLEIEKLGQAIPNIPKTASLGVATKVSEKGPNLSGFFGFREKGKGIRPAYQPVPGLIMAVHPNIEPGTGIYRPRKDRTSFSSTVSSGGAQSVRMEIETLLEHAKKVGGVKRGKKRDVELLAKNLFGDDIAGLKKWQAKQAITPVTLGSAEAKMLAEELRVKGVGNKAWQKLLKGARTNKILLPALLLTGLFGMMSSGGQRNAA